MSEVTTDGRKREPIHEKDLAGFKYFAKILRLLDRLHAEGCDIHGAEAISRA